MCVYGSRAVRWCAVKNGKVRGATAGDDGIIYEGWDHQRRTWWIALSFPADHLSWWRGNDIKLVLISHLVESQFFLTTESLKATLSSAPMCFLRGRDAGRIQTCISHLSSIYDVLLFLSFDSGAGPLSDQPVPARWQLPDGGGGL